MAHAKVASRYCGLALATLFFVAQSVNAASGGITVPIDRISLLPSAPSIACAYLNKSWVAGLVKKRTSKAFLVQILNKAAISKKLKASKLLLSQRIRRKTVSKRQRLSLEKVIKRYKLQLSAISLCNAKKTRPGFSVTPTRTPTSGNTPVPPSPTAAPTSLPVAFNPLPQHCRDGVSNNQETGVDCGGECFACSTNYKSGIDVLFAGSPGVHYAEEYLYHDKLVDDHKVVYLKGSTEIQMQHNERNIYGNYSSAMPAGSNGTIRYRIDRDLQYGLMWSPHSGKPLNPAYVNPFRLQDLEYEPGVPIIGQVGPRPGTPFANGSTRNSQYYIRGLMDEFGDEWHYLGYADDDAWASEALGKSKYNASDGKSVLLVVNPKTPALIIDSLEAGSQFYTTPAKAYFMPKITAQTTYFIGKVKMRFVNISSDARIYYQINNGPVQEYSRDLRENDFQPGSNILEYWFNTSHKKRRTVVRDPAHPSLTESHGTLAFGCDAEFNAFKQSALGGLLSSQYSYNRTQAAKNGALSANTISASRTHADALPYAIVMAVEGVAARRDYAIQAKRRLLSSKRFIDPIGWELSDIYEPQPSIELNAYGYYDVNHVFDNIFAYDFVAKYFRSDQFIDGMTAIEDLRIRDGLANFNLESLMYLGSFGETTSTLPSTGKNTGMWDFARELGSLVVAVGMPNYNTPYYGTSGFNGQPAIHSWTPFRDEPRTWKEALYTRTSDGEAAQLLGYPNQSSAFNHFNGGLIRTDGDFYDRIPYFSILGKAMGITMNVMKRKFNYSYPYMELAYDKNNKIDLYGHKFSNSSDYLPVGFPAALLANGHFGQVSTDAYLNMFDSTTRAARNLPAIGSASEGGWKVGDIMYGLGSFSLLFYNPDFTAAQSCQ